MRRMKSIARRQQTVAASSFSSEEDVSLGADHGEESVPICDATFSSAVSQRRGGVPSQGVNSPASTRHNGRMTFQCQFV
jgi:hypothetical protein